jgi:hypothetical protein
MIKIKKNKVERFRIIKDQQIYSPFDIDLDNYEVYGYLCGERVDKVKGLSLAHFDSLQVIKKSKNANNGKEFLHVIAHRILNKEFTILILKLKG